MKTTIRITLAALAAFALITINAHAVPGTLDATFGTGGKVTTPFGSDTDYGSAVAVQADGKIVVAGHSYIGTSKNTDFALARYTRTGVLDTTFNGTGRVTTDFGGGFESGQSVVVQADGKIVVAGYSSGNSGDFEVARYTSTGALDTTFNGTGKVTTDFGGGDGAKSVALQADGKIVVAGGTYNGGSGDFALVRYTSTGALDTTFNNIGKVTTDFGGDDGIEGVAVQADGKIVVAGWSYIGDLSNFALVRYTSTGALDTSFNGTGKVATDFGGGEDIGSSVVLQADGKIVVAGDSYNSGFSDFALARYTSTGALDTTFNGTGKVTTDLGGGHNICQSVVVQADGKVVVAGNSGPIGHTDFAVARYTSTGTLDPTFNGTGKVTTPIGGGEDEGIAVALQADGKIVVAGLTSNDGSLDFALARYSVSLPDTRLGTTTAAPVGDNKYNLTGKGQTLSTGIPHGGGVKTDFIRIQNDGPVPDSIRVRGTPGNAKFTVKYLNGSTNVTAKVVAGTFNTGKLAPGGSKLLKAVITAKTSRAAQQRNLYIKSTSTSDPAGRDTALIKAKSR